MIQLIRRGARIFGGGVFFIVFIGMLLRHDAFEFNHLIPALVYAFISGISCWFVGIVISDIVVKGVITDLDDIGVTGLLEGGLLQRVQTLQERLVPGGEELPFHEPVGKTGKKGRKGNKRNQQHRE